MPERTNRQRFSNLLAQALRHWGHTPFYIFDLADDGGLVYTDKTGTIRLTKNGDPTVTSPLADDEGKALDFDPADDYLQSDKTNPVPMGTDSFSTFALFNADTIGDPTGILGNRVDGKAGHDLQHLNGNQYRALLEDNSGNTNIGLDGPATTGNNEWVKVTFDRDVDEVRMIVNDTITGTVDISGLGSFSGTTSGFVYGDRLSSTNDGYDGAMHVVGHAGDWQTSIQGAALHNWQQDRDNAPSIPSQLPSYVQNEFGSNLDFCWIHDRHFRHKDQELVTQLSNHTGSGFAHQRSDSKKGTAQGSSDRQSAINDIKTPSKGNYILDSAPSSPHDQLTVVVARIERSEGSRQAFYGADHDSSGLMLLEQNSGRGIFRIDDNSGNKFGASASYGTQISNGELAVTGGSYDLQKKQINSAHSDANDLVSDQNSLSGIGDISGTSPEYIMNYNSNSSIGSNSSLKAVFVKRGFYKTETELKNTVDNIRNKLL